MCAARAVRAQGAELMPDQCLDRNILQRARFCPQVRSGSELKINGYCKYFGNKVNFVSSVSLIHKFGKFRSYLIDRKSVV